MSASDLSDRTEPADDAEPAGAYRIFRAQPVTRPVLFASPHSGRFYPRALTERLRVPLMDLRRTEDAFIDELFAGAVGAGATQMAATYARCYVDLNRDSRELDPTMFEDGLPQPAGLATSRVEAGLGCFPKVAACGEPIYAQLINREEGVFRLSQVYAPYHKALKQEAGELACRFGQVFLIDCHSMPSSMPGRGGLADIVLGDRFGSSCDARLTGLVERTLRAEGLSVVRNAPYAGGFTTRQYGRPRRGVHVLQIEVNRALYLDEACVELHSGFETLKPVFDRLCEEIAALSLRLA